MASTVKYVAVWEWLDTKENWWPYSPEVSQLLERSYQKNLSSVLLGDADPTLSSFSLSLIVMKQIHNETDEESEVRRSFLPQRTPPGSGVMWQWGRVCRSVPEDEEDLVWQEYSIPVQCVIEDAWVKGARKVDISEIFSEWPFAIDFCNLTQHSLRRNEQNPVRRRQQPSYPVAKPPAGYVYPMPPSALYSITSSGDGATCDRGVRVAYDQCSEDRSASTVIMTGTVQNKFSSVPGQNKKEESPLPSRACRTVVANADNHCITLGRREQRMKQKRNFSNQLPSALPCEKSVMETSKIVSRKKPTLLANLTSKSPISKHNIFVKSPKTFKKKKKTSQSKSVKNFIKNKSKNGSGKLHCFNLRQFIDQDRLEEDSFVEDVYYPARRNSDTLLHQRNFCLNSSDDDLKELLVPYVNSGRVNGGVAVVSSGNRGSSVIRASVPAQSCYHSDDATCDSNVPSALLSKMLTCGHLSGASVRGSEKAEGSSLSSSRSSGNFSVRSTMQLSDSVSPFLPVQSRVANSQSKLAISSQSSVPGPLLCSTPLISAHDVSLETNNSDLIKRKPPDYETTMLAREALGKKQISAVDRSVRQNKINQKKLESCKIFNNEILQSSSEAYNRSALDAINNSATGNNCILVNSRACSKCPCKVNVRPSDCVPDFSLTRSKDSVHSASNVSGDIGIYTNITPRLYSNSTLSSTSRHLCDQTSRKNSPDQGSQIARKICHESLDSENNRSHRRSTSQPPTPLPRSVRPPRPLPRTLLPQRSPPYTRVCGPDMSPSNTLPSLDTASLASGRRSSLETISTYLSTEEVTPLRYSSSASCVTKLLDLSLSENQGRVTSLAASPDSTRCWQAEWSASSTFTLRHQDLYLDQSKYLMPIDREDSEDEVFTSADQEVRRVMSATILRTSACAHSISS